MHRHTELQSLLEILLLSSHLMMDQLRIVACLFIAFKLD